MSFLNNTANLTARRKNCTESEWKRDHSAVTNQDLEGKFSLRNYVKESFSVLIARPMSGYLLKIMRMTALLITATTAGTAIAVLCFLILMQFGSLENTILSSVIQSKFEKLIPESDLSVKSAALRWNPEIRALEIFMTKVRLDDLSIPHVSILPDYKQSLKQQKLIVKSVSLINPNISLEISDDFRSIAFNPNLEKGGNNKALFEPLSSVSNLKSLLDEGVILKFINANVSITENGALWKLKNVRCEHLIGEEFPRVVECAVSLPKQKYVSNIKMIRSDTGGNKSRCEVKIDSLNPFAINAALAKRNIPIDARIFKTIDGYNLPVSGTLKLDFAESKFLGGTFDLIGYEGSIRLPVENTLSLNLGKRIDSGNISGSFSENKAKIDSVSVCYGNSELQLTGLSIPLSEFRFLDVANIDGTLSLTNVNVSEMENILPEIVLKSAVSVFKNYLSGFKLELFKVDLNGIIAFGNKSQSEKLNIGQGVFKIKDAKIPLGTYVVNNVSANGIISEDGLDMKLTDASFGKIKINSGTFFISCKDNSWIGKINADIAPGDIYHYAADISSRLAALPLEQTGIKGKVNFDMKLVSVEGNKAPRTNFPFRVVEGTGVVKSDDGAKELRLSWDNGRLFFSGSVNDGKSKINIRMEENLAGDFGKGEFSFVSESDFLNAFIPGLKKICSGNYKLKINSSWKGRFEEYDIESDLKDATVCIPTLGSLKLRRDDGKFSARVRNNNGNWEFSDMLWDAKNSKISGKMTLNRTGSLLKCCLDEFEINKNSAKINLLRKNDGLLLFSAVGDCLDISKIFPLSQMRDFGLISAYINLKEMIISNTCTIKNVKGSIDIENGKPIGGACCGIIGDDTTLAFTTNKTEGINGSLLSLSASNAGEFLKHFGITDTVVGGSVNLVIKLSKTADDSLSGIFEMSNFIVKNNIQLMKLLSLSSTSMVNSTDNSMLGFNSVTGNVALTKDALVIENGKAIGPAICISFSGSYDRTEDNLGISGILAPMAAILNNQNANGALTAGYRVSGSFLMPIISVNALRFTDKRLLDQIFGNAIPIMLTPEDVNTDIAPPNEKISDSFSQEAFDRKAIRNKERNSGKSPSKRRRNTEDRFGIKITRGTKNRR